MSRTILRTPAVIKRRGTSRSAHHADVKAGLFVRPVALDPRARGTPEDEVDALIAATIAGKTSLPNGARAGIRMIRCCRARTTRPGTRMRGRRR